MARQYVYVSYNYAKAATNICHRCFNVDNHSTMKNISTQVARLSPQLFPCVALYYTSVCYTLILEPTNLIGSIRKPVK